MQPPPKKKKEKKKEKRKKRKKKKKKKKEALTWTLSYSYLLSNKIQTYKSITMEYSPQKEA